MTPGLRYAIWKCELSVISVRRAWSWWHLGDRIFDLPNAGWPSSKGFNKSEFPMKGPNSCSFFFLSCHTILTTVGQVSTASI
jgi:hypothetical protein